MGKTLSIFVMGDDSSALKQIELSNWNGGAYVGSREHLGQIKGRQELTQPAVYILASENIDEEGLINIYIGETDDFVNRLSQHVKDESKDWWDKFVVFYGAKLNKAHVRFLERELMLLAKQSIATLKVRNGNDPGGARISEQDESTCRAFLENTIFILETLGIGYFSNLNSGVHKAASKGKSNQKVGDGEEFILTLPKEFGLKDGKPLCGRLKVRNGRYVLIAGSYIRIKPFERFTEHSYSKLWEKISTSDQVIKCPEFKDVALTVEDIEFKSPSAAGAIVRARAVNGRVEWKRLSDGQSIADLESEALK